MYGVFCVEVFTPEIISLSPRNLTHTKADRNKTQVFGSNRNTRNRNIRLEMDDINNVAINISQGF